MGGFPDTMTRVAELLSTECEARTALLSACHAARGDATLGARVRTQVDFVDINSGCPIDGVCNKGGGCQLMENRHGR